MQTGTLVVVVEYILDLVICRPAEGRHIWQLRWESDQILNRRTERE